MEDKIQQLADKLLKEGVDKGNVEANKIIDEAKNKAADIIKEAKEQAENIIQEANKKAKELDANTKSELKMFNAQSINALKSQITNVVGDKIIKETVSKFTGDKNFMNEFILKLASKWADNDNIVISTEDAKGLKAFFANKAKELLDKKVTIKEVNGQKANFVISPENGAYKVAFGEEEFENYFKSFLRPQLIDMLF